MCKYVDYKEGKCNISSRNCPYMYYCNKSLSYKESRNMPKNCKVALEAERPEGSYEVCFCRHGNLYVQVGDYVEIVPNPYEYVPQYIKMVKTKNGKWRIKNATP